MYRGLICKIGLFPNSHMLHLSLRAFHPQCGIITHRNIQMGWKLH
ncbi:hypothetical protein HanPSC8_Chr11g0462651 [Helianthus annuus]|nr:hypothetical protein HanPSC8_Chr11g0462651 [Helianthus annuus]